MKKLGTGTINSYLVFMAVAFVAGMLLNLRPSSAKTTTNHLFSKQAPTDAASIQRGKELYELKCRWCHGDNGDGKGIIADRVNPKPRDFTKGTYKFRTTQSGEIPTDWDIFRSISEGLHGTSMYSWKGALPEKDRWALVAFIKTFSDRFKNEQVTKDKILTEPVPGEKGSPYPGDPGKASAALLQEGDKLYHDPNGAKCYMCHGDKGRGNGPSADSLTDDWNNPIWPADLTKGYDLRGGDTPQDIYRGISTGLSGSPMPSYRGSLDADDKKDTEKRWALAYYVKNLQAPRKLGSLVKAVPIKGEVPADPNDPRWDKMDWIDIPMAGQVIADPREFTPSIDNLSVKACYNDKNVSFLVTWEDRTKNISTDASKKKFTDAVELQFPVKMPKDPTQEPKPYFLNGDSKRPVDLWIWQAGGMDKIQEANGTGIQKISPKKKTLSVAAKSIFDNGEWKVVFTRPLFTSGKDRDIQFTRGKYIPIAFSAWDGNNGEHDTMRAISTWYYLLLIPPASKAIVAVPVIAALAGIGLLWLIQKEIRRTQAKI